MPGNNGKPKTTQKGTLDLGPNFANIEFEVYEDDEEEEIQEAEPESVEVKIEIDENSLEGPPQKKVALESRSCSYFNCKNNTRKNPKLMLYPFPNKNSKLFEKQYKDWVTNSGLTGENEANISQKFICEDHFQSSAFLNPATKGRLRSAAVPMHYKGVFVPDLEDELMVIENPTTQPSTSSVSVTTGAKQPSAMPVISVLKDPSCAVCKEKFNTNTIYVKVPDIPYLRSLWEITTQKTLTPFDIVCDKHFASIELPSAPKLNTTSNIFNHRPTCLPCLTPFPGCCVSNCVNRNDKNVSCFTFDLRNKEIWLKRLANQSYYGRSDRDLLRLRACSLHFDPNVMRRFKFYETELIPVRNMPGSGSPIANSPTTTCTKILTPIKLTTVGPPAVGVPVHVLPSGSGAAAASGSGLQAGQKTPAKVDKVIINRLQCLYKNCQKVTTPSCRLYRLPQNLDKAKAWLKQCSRQDILRLLDKDLEDFVKKAEGICEEHIGLVYKSHKTGEQKTKMICGFGSCSASIMTGAQIFSFPTDSVLRQKWLDLAGLLPRYKVTDFFDKSIGICIAHFKLSSFDDQMELMPNAIPDQHCLDRGSDLNFGINVGYTNYADPESADNKKGIFNKCIVGHCPRDIKSLSVPFHYFPHPTEDPERYQIWVALLKEKVLHSSNTAATDDNTLLGLSGISPHTVWKMYRICADHFESFFFNDTERKLLKKIAVPTVNVNGNLKCLLKTPFVRIKLKKFVQDHNITNFLPETPPPKLPPPPNVETLVNECSSEILKQKLESDKKSQVISAIKNRPKEPARLMQWVEYNTENVVKDEITTKCVLEKTGLSFPNLGKKLTLANPEEESDKFPFGVYKFDVSEMKLSQDLKPGTQLQIHTAIIIDDDDQCEEQVMAQIFTLLRKQQQEKEDDPGRVPES